MTHKELSPPDEVYDMIGDEYYELPEEPMNLGDSMAMQHGIDTSQQDDNSATQHVINTAQNATAVSPVVVDNLSNEDYLQPVSSVYIDTLC